MEISSLGEGEVYYRLYNSVTNERVTNKEFVEIYDRVVLNKQQNDPIDLTTDLPSIEELISKAKIIAIFSLAEVIIDNIYQIIDFAIENIIPCLG